MRLPALVAWIRREGAWPEGADGAACTVAAAGSLVEDAAFVPTDAAARALSGSMNSTCSAGPAPRIRRSKYEMKNINGVELCGIKCEIIQWLSMFGCSCYAYIHTDTIAITIKTYMCIHAWSLSARRSTMLWPNATVQLRYSASCRCKTIVLKHANVLNAT
jgi:hypothetical protein